VQCRLGLSTDATPKQKFSLECAYEISNDDGKKIEQMVLREFQSTGSRVI